MKKSIFQFLLVVAALGVLPLAAQAQTTPRQTTVLTITDSSIASSATEVSTSQAFAIKPDSGFGVVVDFVLNGADTANITFNFAVSMDGTTWTTLTPLSAAFASNGTTAVIAFANFPPHVAGGGANNIAYARLATIQNASATRIATINSVTITRNN